MFVVIVYQESMCVTCMSAQAYIYKLAHMHIQYTHIAISHASERSHALMYNTQADTDWFIYVFYARIAIVYMTIENNTVEISTLSRILPPFSQYCLSQFSILATAMQLISISSYMNIDIVVSQNVNARSYMYLCVCTSILQLNTSGFR